VVEGATTPVFARNARHVADANRCFSLIAASRTLDLECASREERDEWVTAFMCLKKYRRAL
jgi:hypothetical protein